MMENTKRKHLIYIFLIVLSLTSAFTLHSVSYYRIFDSFKSLASSAIIYVIEVFGIPLKRLPDFGGGFSIDVLKYLPFEFDEFVRKLRATPFGLFNVNYFRSYLIQVLLFLYDILYYVVLLLPIYLLLKMLIVRQYLATNDKTFNDKSKALVLYLSKIRPKKERIKSWMHDLVSFGKQNRYLKVLFIFWLFNLNIISICIELLAYYLLLVATFTFETLPIQIARTLLDVIIMFSLAPAAFWVVVFCIIIDKIRRQIGYSKLCHNEAKNKGFINALPLNNLIVGVMEAGKTTLAVDMALSYEQILRDKALELMLKNDYHFEKFPFRSLERAIESEVRVGRVINLATVRKYVREQYKIFAEDPSPSNCYGYDFETFGYLFDDRLVQQSLFDMIIEYAQLYFIYFMPSSLIISNIAIRADAQQINNGHFPLWADDFFHSTIDDENSYYSHIIDFDLFRMGKKIGNSDQESCIEFGVGVMSEKGKERGNALENKQYKKDDVFANPLNDLFNSDLKLRRHSATVGYYPFIKFFSDEQRPESVGADEREVSHILHMNGVKSEGIAMPLFGIEELLGDYLNKRFTGFYLMYRNVRSDSTLFVYLLKSLIAKFSQHCERIKNTFGYKRMEILTEHGTMDGEPDKHDYYISYKKIYADRFSTDCYKDVYERKAIKAKIGMHNMPTYNNSCATLDELKQQNSYFINDIIRFNTDDESKQEQKIYRSSGRRS